MDKGEKRGENRSGKNNSVLKKQCTNFDSKFTKYESRNIEK